MISIQRYPTAAESQKIELNGKLICSVSASPSASGSMGCGIAYVATIVPKGVALRWSLNPTYTNGPRDNPIAIENTDPTNINVNVGLVKHGDLYEVNQYLIANTWGNWSDPQYVWSFKDSIYDEAYISHLARTYTTDTVASMETSGPLILKNKVTAIDIDGTASTANATIRVYPPEFMPTLNQQYTAYGDWSLASGCFQRSPAGPQTITESETFTKTITWSITLGVNPEGSLKFGPNDALTVALKLNASGTYGQSASIAKSATYSFTLKEGPKDDFWVYIRTRPFWHQMDGCFWAYGMDGFAGLQNITFTSWASATREDAERVDRDYEICSTLVHP